MNSALPTTSGAWQQELATVGQETNTAVKSKTCSIEILMKLCATCNFSYWKNVVQFLAIGLVKNSTESRHYFTLQLLDHWF